MFFMNKELISPLVQSAIRLGIGVVVGWTGVEVAQGDVDKVVGVISLIALAGGSLLWSHFTQKKLLNTTPEK